MFHPCSQIPDKANLKEEGLFYFRLSEVSACGRWTVVRQNMVAGTYGKHSYTSHGRKEAEGDAEERARDRL